MILIGIAGKKRSGKNTLADKLGAAFVEMGIGYSLHALAEAVKQEIAVALNTAEPSSSVETYLKMMNSDDATEKEFMRPIMKWWGTEFRRGLCRDDYWIEKWKTWVTENDSPGVVIVPDVRFVNECLAIKDLGGKVILIERPSIAEINKSDAHSSENDFKSYTDWDITVVNDGTTEDLYDKAFIIMVKILLTEYLL